MKKEILQAIIQYETIIIHRHVRPDPDAYGSQCGLAEIIKTSFPSKCVYVVGESDPSLQFLYSLDHIDNEVYNGALVIVCDTANQDRICGKQYSLGDKLIKIDHHPNDDAYGDIVWVDTNASSCSELIYELYLYGRNQGLKLSKQGARLIFAGIVGDTGRFLYPSTSKKTFKYAGELIELDIDFTEIYEGLYKTKNNVANLSGYVLQNFISLPSGAAYMKIPASMLTSYNVSPSEASLLVSLLGNIEGIKAWLFFVEEDGAIRVRLRSKGPIINELAKKYRGGGHPFASGATIFDWQEADEMIEQLDQICKKG
ncbi:bifunctional oligoribonuclease/PAP phosphatase NrnA [Bacillus sp. HMF5848]|uniref:DHH family phosphoesterase n=1 Tax=Bacillus sp. HMF5848 TaxID=2495421 RepID=UPI000F7A0086|nr:bifunctional oligoribonuclease/PAP phosphatase NrnA [Bacillus sp. HMF5848]RSK28145.1 bifunctional oligoribonuclease/PAP phosphatase NrnA [Bacillus sp. HMF5848]